MPASDLESSLATDATARPTTGEHGSPIPIRAPVDAALLTLTPGSRGDRVLPVVTDALPLAELIHRSLVRIADPSRRDGARMLTGCDDAARPLSGHRHAHLVPLDLDEDDLLDHVLERFDQSVRPSVAGRS
jgi:hypothetical protein